MRQRQLMPGIRQQGLEAVGLRALNRRGLVGDAGVVDRHVRSSELRDDRGDHGLGGGFVGDVIADEASLGTVDGAGLQIRDGGIADVLAATADDDGDPLSNQLAGGFQTDAAGPAGDEGNWIGHAWLLRWC
jgi:hypothetical protein